MFFVQSSLISRSETNIRVVKHTERHVKLSFPKRHFIPGFVLYEPAVHLLNRRQLLTIHTLPMKDFLPPAAPPLEFFAIPYPVPTFNYAIKPRSIAIYHALR